MFWDHLKRTYNRVSNNTYSNCNFDDKIEGSLYKFELLNRFNNCLKDWKRCWQDSNFNVDTIRTVKRSRSNDNTTSPNNK